MQSKKIKIAYKALQVLWLVLFIGVFNYLKKLKKYL